MLLFFNFNMPNILLFMVLILVNNTFNIKYFSHSIILDLMERVFLNDFYLYNFYFFWTNLWYLPIFIFTLCLLILYKNILCNLFICSLYYLITFTFFVIYLEFNNNNLNLYENSIFNENINVLLINNINKIHPFLLYFSSAILIYIFILLYNSFLNSIHQRSSYYLNFFYRKIFFFYIINSIAIFLGSWWAFQEGSWGGWWNWDSSEVFALLILLKILILYHSNIFLNSFYIKLEYLKSSLFYLIIFYLFMQINFSLISHNFGFKIMQFIDKDYLIILFIIKLLFNVLLGYLNLSLYYSYTKALGNKKKHFIIYFLFILFYSIIYGSLLLLINNFLWELLKINILNIQLQFNILIIFILFYFIYFLFQFNIYLTLFSYFYNTLIINYLIVLFIKLVKFIKVNLRLHFLFLFLICLVLLKTNINLNIWKYNNVILNKESSLTLLYNLNNLEMLNNFIISSTSLEAKSFNLLFIFNKIQQNFYPTDATFYIIFENNLEVILIIFLLILIPFYLYCYNNKIIIF